MLNIMQELVIVLEKETWLEFCQWLLILAFNIWKEDLVFLWNVYDNTTIQLFTNILLTLKKHKLIYL